MLAHGQYVGQHLGRMPLVGEPVPHRHAGERAEYLRRLLGKTAEFDTVEHPAEYPGRVLDRLLVAEMGVLRTEIGNVPALVMRRDLEGRPGPRRCLLEDQRNVAPGQPAGPLAQVLRHGELRAQVDQVAEFLRREVSLLEQVPSLQIHYMLLAALPGASSHATWAA